MEGQREDIEAWKQNPWSKLPMWGKWTVGVLGAVVLLVVGAAIGGSGEDELKVDLSRAESQLAAANQERDEAKASADTVLDRKGDILGRAKSNATKIVGNARSERSRLSGKLKGLQGEVDATEDELSSVEASLDGAKKEKANSTIPGDGTFRADVDYIPGTYESAGGEGCYWATLNSADPFDIASNENATGPTIAEITTPYFQTEGCGNWKRIE